MAAGGTKADLVARAARHTGLTKRECTALVDDLFALMKDALRRGEKVKITGFGNFVPEDRAARRGQDPRTGKPLVIARRKVVVFRYAPRLKALLNGDDR